MNDIDSLIGKKFTKLPSRIINEQENSKKDPERTIALPQFGASGMSV